MFEKLLKIDTTTAQTIMKMAKLIINHEKRITELEEKLDERNRSNNQR